MKETRNRRQVLVILGLCALGLVAWVGMFAASVYFAFQESGVSFDELRDLLSGRRTRLSGRIAPDFELTTLDGETIRLADHVGKKVILLNFFATWCGPCKREMPELVSFAEAQRERPFLLLGIDGDEERGDVEAFLQQFNVRYPVGIDTSSIQRAYRVRSYPTTVLIGADGRIKQYRVGAIHDAEGTFREDLEEGWEVIASGGSISKEDYLALEADDGAERASDGPLEGRAHHIASVMTCPCGCDNRVIDCNCDTAQRIRASLERGDDFDLPDEKLIEKLNARFCVGARLETTAVAEP